MQLTPHDIESFQQQGFLHLGSVVPAERCIAAEDAVWRAVTWRRDDPASWPQGSVHPAGWDLAEVRACFTGDVLFYQRNGVHAGTANFSDRPRVALQTMVHLNAAGEVHARDRLTPRTPAEWSYDRHFEDYHLFNYFACRAKNMSDE